MLKATVVLLTFIILAAAHTAKAQPLNQSEVIVLVAPQVNDSYYAPVFQQVIDYDIAFVNTVRQHSNVVLVVDSATYLHVQGHIPEANIVVASVNDIWVRDFSPVFPNNPVKFRYRPQYLDNGTAAWIENSFNNWTNGVGLTHTNTSIVLDGGNVTHNGVDKAVISTRVFEDNSAYSEAALDQLLRDQMGVSTIAYIPYEDIDTTAHSDGMVMWLDANTLLVNEYDEPFRSEY